MIDNVGANLCVRPLSIFSLPIDSVWFFVFKGRKGEHIGSPLQFAPTVKGKNNELYEYDYIRAYTGIDFIGNKVIDKRIRKVKYLQNYLKEKFNIDFILVFEPGKATVIPENISKKYFKDARSETNFQSYIENSKKYDVRFIDFNSWFKKLKATSKYPLYSPSYIQIYIFPIS